MIGFNIVASVEYNDSFDNLSTIADGLSGTYVPGGFRYPGASDYLLDVTDGQMFFENVTIYESKANWDDADYQFFASYPRADANRLPDGRSALTGTCCHIHVQASGHFGSDPWNQTASYSALIHEFTHYAIGALDEYFYQSDGDNADCSLDQEPDYQKRASIMAYQGDSSEYCTQDNHNPLTAQGAINGESVWETLVRNWDDDMGRWNMVSPINRGFTDPGPFSYICDVCEQAVPVIVPDTEPACPPIQVHVIGPDGISRAGVKITLKLQGFHTINEGQTNRFGNAIVYGGEVGQLQYVSASFADPNDPTHVIFATGDITSCNAFTIQLPSLSAPEQSGQSSQPVDQLPLYWITSTVSFSQTQVHPVIHFAAIPSSPPSLYAGQGGTDSQQVALTYDPTGHNYSGDFTFDPARSLDFQFEVGITGTQGLQTLPHTFVAAQYHSTGPDGSHQGKTPTLPSTGPAHWDIFPPETNGQFERGR